MRCWILTTYTLAVHSINIGFNNYDMTNKIYISFIIGFIAALSIGFVFSNFPFTKTAQAGKYVLINNDIYLSQADQGSKRITTSQDVRFLYGEKNNKLLLGKIKKNSQPGSEQIESSDLYLIDVNTGIEESITQDDVDWASFDKKERLRVVYVTRDAKVNIYDLITKKKIAVIDKALNPDISFDGTKVVYKKLAENWQVGDYLEDSTGLIVQDLNTGSETLLTKGAEDFAPFWSPDGDKILFYSTNSKGLISLFVVDSDGSNITQLTNIDQEFVSDKTVDSPSELPIWSNDGRYIVYESDRRIWVNELDLNERKLVSAKAISYGVAPSWVENGNTLSVVTTKGNSKASSVTTIDLDGNIVEN